MVREMIRSAYGTVLSAPGAPSVHMPLLIASLVGASVTSADVPPRVGIWSRVAFALGLVGLFAFVFERNMAFNALRSRLSSVPRYDDVVYLLDAVRRLTFDMQGGFGSFADGILASPPHAPASTLTAMLGFTLFGHEVRSAYLANGWILALYIATLAVLSRPLVSLPARFLLVAILLFVPISHVMITEFRPDMAAGLVFALALLAIASTDLLTSSPWRRIGVAALCVAATIVKPSGVILVIPGIGIAVAMTALVQACATGVPIVRVLRGALLPAATYVVLLAPFAIVWGQPTARYIYQALVYNKDIWQTDGGFLFHALYHSFDKGGRAALKPFNWIAIPVIAADLFLLSRAGPSRERQIAHALYLTLVVLYIAMATSAEKTPFQGSFFYCPFVLVLAGAMARVGAVARQIWPSRNVTLALAAVALVLLATRPIVTSFSGLPASASELPSLLTSTADEIAKFGATQSPGSICSGRNPRLLTTNPDPFPPEAILLDLALRGITIDYSTSPLSRTAGEVDALVGNADLVLIPDPAMPGRTDFLPGTAFEADLLARLSRDPVWTGRAMGAVGGAPLWLFERTACLPGATPF